jgi:hypothetical protein
MASRLALATVHQPIPVAAPVVFPPWRRLNVIAVSQSGNYGYGILLGKTNGARQQSPVSSAISGWQTTAIPAQLLAEAVIDKSRLPR